MRRQVRRFLLSPIVIALATSLGIYILIPKVIQARTTASFAQCRNHLFQHSGSHPRDIVWLDRELNVLSAGSCPLCSHPALSPSFLVRSENDRVWIVSESDLPDFTVRTARHSLETTKQDPEYRRLRQKFTTPEFDEIRDRLAGIESSRPSPPRQD